MSEQSEAAKDYSLKEIETWIWDALENGCTPDEIYGSIKGTVLKSLRYHKACYNQGKELFNKLSDTPYLEVFDGDKVRQQLSAIWEGTDVEPYEPDYFKLDSPELHNYNITTSSNDVHIETNANSPYNDGWTREFYREQLEEKRKDIDNEEV